MTDTRTKLPPVVKDMPLSTVAGGYRTRAMQERALVGNGGRIFHHPLLRLAEGRHTLPPPPEDVTPADFMRHAHSGIKAWLKLVGGRFLYPLKNKIERVNVEEKLAEAGVTRNISATADLIAWGDRGFGNDLFLQTISRHVGQVDSVACIGCGTGVELLNIVRFLRPRRVVGYEYFNYARAWEFVRRELIDMGVEARFVQCDLRNPSNDGERVDLLFSGAVLEHLHSLPDTFEHMSRILKPGGWFTSIWGPLWYTYSGDHIAGELGFEYGFQHIMLSPDDYVRWHAAHPRNAESISRGEATWLEMGLVSYAQYAEYMQEIERYFGRVVWLGWAISKEAFRWRMCYRQRWEKLLNDNSHIGPLDLLLKSVAVIARRFESVSSDT